MTKAELIQKIGAVARGMLTEPELHKITVLCSDFISDELAMYEAVKREEDDDEDFEEYDDFDTDPPFPCESLNDQMKIEFLLRVWDNFTPQELEKRLSPSPHPSCNGS